MTERQKNDTVMWEWVLAGSVGSIGASLARSEHAEPIGSVKGARGLWPMRGCAEFDRCISACDPRPTHGRGVRSVGLVSSVPWFVGWSR
jgi:hypothetical protein